MAKKAKPSRSRIRLREMTINIMNKRASTRKAEGEKKRKLEQELAQMILDKETFKRISKTTRKKKRPTKRTLMTLAVYPVVPNSPVLPGWVHSVHTSHQVVLVGGLVGCLRCGSIVAARRLTLRKHCAGRYTPSTSVAGRWQRLGQGLLPHYYKTWPDELAAPRDVRPVGRLRHTGSEWVLDSHVTVGVFTAESDDCRDRLKSGVSWDPYFPSAPVE